MTDIKSVYYKLKKEESMKLKYKAIAIIVSALTMNNMAQAADGNIEFTGAIVSNSCKVTGTGSSDSNFGVTLGKVHTNALKNSGVTAAPTPFTIKLSDCVSVTSASVTFDGTLDSNNKSLLKLSPVTDAATFVGIGIYESNSSTLIPLLNKSATKTLINGAANLEFVAKYVATGTATPGVANASATFTVNYN